MAQYFRMKQMKRLLNYLALQPFGIERTWWRS